MAGNGTLAGAPAQLLLELNHIRRFGPDPGFVVAAHDLPHLGLCRRTPANFRHLTAANVAYLTNFLKAQHEIRGDVVFLILHHPGIGDRVNSPCWLPVPTDLGHRPRCGFQRRMRKRHFDTLIMPS